MHVKIHDYGVELVSSADDYPPGKNYEIAYFPLLSFRVKLSNPKIWFFFHIFDENETTYATYECVMKSELFKVIRNKKSPRQIEQIYYSGEKKSSDQHNYENKYQVKSVVYSAQVVDTALL